MTDIKIYRPETIEDLATAQTLLREFANQTEYEACFHDFQAEDAVFPKGYQSPDGALLLARIDGKAVGVVGLRKISDQTSEMKRLYLREAARGHGIGRKLATGIVEEARRLGYSILQLETLQIMKAAQSLYRSMGFTNVALESNTPHSDIINMELELS